jgi:hypothetical protein
MICTLLGGTAPVGAQDDAFPATPLSQLGLPELRVSTDGVTVNAPATLDAGRYYLVLENSDPAASAAVEFYQAPEGTAAADLIPGFQDAAAQNQPPPNFYDSLIAGGVSAQPGGTGEAVIDLPAGSWLASVYVFGGDVDTLLAQPVEVTGDIGDPDDPDGDIDLNFEDFGFDLDAELPAGSQVWELENDGAQPHFVSIYSYPGELTEDAVNATLFNAYGAAPEEFDSAATPIDFSQLVEVGGSGTMSSGVEAWLQLDLAPGTYLAWCQVVDQESGLPHAALGQFEIFTVA